MLLRSSGQLALASGWLALALLTGCALSQVQSPVCQSDTQCAIGSTCFGGTCLPKGVPQGVWAIQLVPTSDSSAAPTELASVNFGNGDDVTPLVADAKVTVTGQLAVGSALTGASHVVATVWPAIGGSPDLQFEAEWSAPTGGGNPIFTLTVPASTIGDTAALQIIPLPPRDQAQPPVSTTVTLAPQIAVTVSSDFTFASGRLVSAVQSPLGGFSAEAFQGTQLVSNIFPITDNGQFRLAVPVAATASDPNHFITIELIPMDAQGPDPSFTTHAISLDADVDLGDLSLPAYGNPNYFRFVVSDPHMQPVSGAIVTLRTVISNDSTGSADYVRSGTSDVNGRVDLALLPGTADMARPYDISVTPPPGSPSGVTCLTSFPITTGNAGTGAGYGDPPVAARLSLPARAIVAGTILSASGAPVAGVAIAATRTAADPTQVCADPTTSLPANASSGPDGSYQLTVDPGTYQIDYDPPAGAPVPRLTETGVTVTAAGYGARVVQMLPGAVVSGLVTGPDGSPLASAGVRFFEVVCSGNQACYGADRVAPLLRAQAHTGADGTFNAVVPMQLPAPP